MIEWKCVKIQSRTARSFPLWGYRVSCHFLWVCVMVSLWLLGTLIHMAQNDCPNLELGSLSAPANMSQRPNSKFPGERRWLVQLGWRGSPLSVQLWLRTAEAHFCGKGIFREQEHGWQAISQIVYSLGGRAQVGGILSSQGVQYQVWVGNYITSRRSQIKSRIWNSYSFYWTIEPHARQHFKNFIGIDPIFSTMLWCRYYHTH